MDCIELMQEMKAQGIKADWLITDPPYGISFASDYALCGGEQNGKTLCPKKQYLYKDWDEKKMWKITSNFFGGKNITQFIGI